MIHLERGPAPGFWTRERVQEWTDLWRDKVRESRRWSWPQYKGKKLNQHAREAMEPWHHDKCAFCEDPFSAAEIEHFRSKARHPLAAFVWRNLFLICSRCNQAKLDRDHEGCLKPDRKDPADYLWVNPISRQVEPKRGISEQARQRAQRTIELYGLDRPELKEAYKLYLKWIFHGASVSDLVHQTSDEVYLHPTKLQASAYPDQAFSLMVKCLLKYWGAVT